MWTSQGKNYSVKWQCTVPIQSIHWSRITGGPKSTKFWWVTGHRGQRQNLQASLTIGFFFFHQKSIFFPLDFSWATWQLVLILYFKFLTYRHRHFNEIFGQSHHPWSCDETKISLHGSQVTRCDELIELALYHPWLIKSLFWEQQTKVHHNGSK